MGRNWVLGISLNSSESAITADSELSFLHVCFIQSSTELLSGFNPPSPPLTTTKNLLSFLNHLLRRTSTNAGTKPRGEDVQRAQS